nr:hypothetical protein [Tanacetum cinerariifolium]
SDPDSPTPKPTKATKTSKPSAPKAAPVTKPVAAKAFKSTSSQQPKPKPAPAKTQKKKRKLVAKTSNEPSPAKSSKPGKVTKRSKPTSSLSLIDEFVDEGILKREPRFDDEEANMKRAVEESLKSVHDAHRGKGKEKVSGEQVTLDLLTLRTPKKVSPAEQYIFQRRTAAPTEPSGQAESPSIYMELGLIDSDMKSDGEVPLVVKIRAQDEGQAGPNPGVLIEGQAGSWELIPNLTIIITLINDARLIFKSISHQSVGFNSLVHSLHALSTLRRSSLRTASVDAKPYQGDSSELYLITGKSNSNAEPLEQVQNNDEYNVFANVNQHCEQSESTSNTCFMEKDDSPNSLDMCENDIQTDQNAKDERAALTNLIANLKLDVDENKKIQKQLKKANMSLSHELEQCQSILAETSKTLEDSNRIRDSCLVALQTKQTEFEKKVWAYGPKGHNITRRQYSTTRMTKRFTVDDDLKEISKITSVRNKAQRSLLAVQRLILKNQKSTKSNSNAEPLEQVQNNDEYTVFANVNQHCEQSESTSNTCFMEKDDSDVTPNLLDMCENDIQTDQNAKDERAALANLIANLKLDVDENKKIQKQLKKA